MLIPSTWTHRLTRAYTSTLNTPQVFHKHTPAVLFGKQLLCGGLLLHRHKTPLTRRFVVYYCSALYRANCRHQDLPDDRVRQIEPKPRGESPHAPWSVLREARKHRSAQSL